MIELLTGTAVDSTRYLRVLNEVFGNWGGREQFRWAFERDAGAGPADLMVFHDNGDWLAGSAVSYRVVVDGAGRSSTMGIMTGSWTLPAARGQGLFTRVIERSVELVNERGGSHLLAFVTHDNASRRRLEAAGAWMIPTSYVFSTADTPPASSELLWHEISLDDTGRLPVELAESRKGRAHFSYPNGVEGQFLARSGSVRVLRSSRGDLAVVELVGGSARLQLYAADWGDVRALAGLLGYAQQLGAGFFWFRPGDCSQLASELGMTRKEGFLTVLPTGPQASRKGGIPSALAEWAMDSGDRM